MTMGRKADQVWELPDLLGIAIFEMEGERSPLHKINEDMKHDMADNIEFSAPCLAKILNKVPKDVNKALEDLEKKIDMGKSNGKTRMKRDYPWIEKRPSVHFYGWNQGKFCQLPKNKGNSYGTIYDKRKAIQGQLNALKDSKINIDGIGETNVSKALRELRKKLPDQGKKRLFLHACLGEFCNRAEPVSWDEIASAIPFFCDIHFFFKRPGKNRHQSIAQVVAKEVNRKPFERTRLISKLGIDRENLDSILLLLTLEKVSRKEKNDVEEESDHLKTKEDHQELTSFESFANQVKMDHIFVVLEGPGGAGKSTYLKMLSKYIIEDKVFGKIPFYVDLNRYEGNSIKDFLYQILEEELGESSDYRDALMTLILEERMVILMDGLDEMSNELQEEFTQEVITFLSELSQKFILSIIVTTRPIDIDLQGFLRYRINPLTDDEIGQFTKSIVEEGKVKGIERDIFYEMEHDSALFELCRNPFFLTAYIMTGLATGEWKGTRVEIFERMVEEFLERGHDRCKEKGGDVRSYIKRKEKIIRRIAFENTYRRRMIFCADDIKDVTDITDLSELERLAKVDGLLIKNGSSYSFFHRSFQEYLAAKYLGTINFASYLQKEENFYDMNWWLPVLLFYNEMLNDSTLLIDTLFGEMPQEDILYRKIQILVILTIEAKHVDEEVCHRVLNKFMGNCKDLYLTYNEAMPVVQYNMGGSGIHRTTLHESRITASNNFIFEEMLILLGKKIKDASRYIDFPLKYFLPIVHHNENTTRYVEEYFDRSIEALDRYIYLFKYDDEDIIPIDITKYLIHYVEMKLSNNWKGGMHVREYLIRLKEIDSQNTMRILDDILKMLYQYIEKGNLSTSMNKNSIELWVVDLYECLVRKYKRIFKRHTENKVNLEKLCGIIQKRDKDIDIPEGATIRDNPDLQMITTLIDIVNFFDPPLAQNQCEFALAPEKRIRDQSVQFSFIQSKFDEAKEIISRFQATKEIFSSLELMLPCDFGSISSDKVNAWLIDIIASEKDHVIRNTLINTLGIWNKPITIYSQVMEKLFKEGLFYTNKLDGVWDEYIESDIDDKDKPSFLERKLSSYQYLHYLCLVRLPPSTKINDLVEGLLEHHDPIIRKYAFYSYSHYADDESIMKALFDRLPEMTTWEVAGIIYQGKFNTGISRLVFDMIDGSMTDKKFHLIGSSRERIRMIIPAFQSKIVDRYNISSGEDKKKLAYLALSSPSFEAQNVLFDTIEDDTFIHESHHIDLVFSFLSALDTSSLHDAHRSRIHKYLFKIQPHITDANRRFVDRFPRGYVTIANKYEYSIEPDFLFRIAKEFYPAEDPIKKENPLCEQFELYTVKEFKEIMSLLLKDLSDVDNKEGAEKFFFNNRFLVGVIEKIFSHRIEFKEEFYNNWWAGIFDELIRLKDVKEFYVHKLLLGFVRKVDVDNLIKLINTSTEVYNINKYFKHLEKIFGNNGIKDQIIPKLEEKWRDEYLDAIIWFYHGMVYDSKGIDQYSWNHLAMYALAYFSPLKEKWEEYWKMKPSLRPDLLSSHVRLDKFVEYYPLESIENNKQDQEYVGILYSTLRFYKEFYKEWIKPDWKGELKYLQENINTSITTINKDMGHFFYLMNQLICAKVPLEIRSTALLTFNAHPMREFTDKMIRYCQSLPDWNQGLPYVLTFKDYYNPDLEILEGYGTDNWFWLYHKEDEPQTHSNLDTNSLPYKILHYTDERGLPLYLDLWKKGIIGNLMNYDPESEEDLDEIFLCFIKRKGITIQRLLDNLSDWPRIKQCFIMKLPEMSLPEDFNEVILKDTDI